MAGVFAGIGRFFDAGPLVAAAEASRWLRPSDGLWRGTIYSLEPSLVIAGAAGAIGEAADSNPFFASAPPPTTFLVWSAVWIVGGALHGGFSLRGARSQARSRGSGLYHDRVHDRLQFGPILRRCSGIVRGLDDDALAIDIEDPEVPAVARPWA